MALHMRGMALHIRVPRTSEYQARSGAAKSVSHQPDAHHAQPINSQEKALRKHALKVVCDDDEFQD